MKRTGRIFLCLLALLFSVCGALSSCKKRETEQPAPPDTEQRPDNPGGAGDDTDEGWPETIFDPGMANTGKVGMAAEYLGTVARRLPEVSDGGLGKYPVYGVTLSTTAEEKAAILAENNALVASADTYDSMDADGNLYLAGEPVGRKLYKHTAAAGMYEGDVSDDEPALVKRLTIRSRSRGNHITGLYAPAGEVVKVEMSEDDLRATGGLVVYIGQVLTNGQSNNIWQERDFNRMPVISNTMTVKAPVSYVGSFLGGPVYVRPVNAGAQFTVTLSGAVAYSHFVYGYTTREEFERNRTSSAPYFDLEVWDDSVRHSGPKARAERFDYDQLTDAAVLWDKIACVSNRVPAGSSGDTGITFLYDPFIAAGSMVAFVGRYTCNCPPNCLTAALDAESAVENPSDAFWGCIHEFNHHYQRFGFHPGDEVTNNAVSLVEYSLFTRVSARRALGSADQGSYAVGWNRYTNPAWTLLETLNNGSVNSGLDSYANLLHAFGQDTFIAAAAAGNGAGGADAWYRAVSDATGYDMTYYFTEVLHQTVSDDVLDEYAAKSRPVYVPAAVIYQTGRTYVRDGHTAYSRTAQPYGIATGEAFTLDFNENLVLPDGFRWMIERVTAPAYGTLTKTSDGVYTYTPDPAHRRSGEMYVTVGLVREDGAFQPEDITFVIELQQQQSAVPERTVYTYAAESMYDDPVAAFENGYAGYETVKTGANTNRVQNSNSEIWEPEPTANAVMEVSGKFRASAAGRYRIALRGRRRAALFISADGADYTLAADLVNAAGTPDFDLTDSAHYTDVQLDKGQWLYFKAVLIVSDARSFIGVGCGRFVGDSVRVEPLNAYPDAYAPEAFTTDYFYPRVYGYDYAQTPEFRQSLVSARYSPWDETYAIEALFDADRTNYIHSDRTSISADNPFEVVADLGETVRANRLTIYGAAARPYLPVDFELYGGETPDDMTRIAAVTDAAVTGANVIVDFAPRTLRYYRLTVTDTAAVGPKYIAYRYAEFSYTVPGGTLLSPDDSRFVYKGGWSVTGALATFGHLYAGRDATVDFTFRGTRFAVLSLASDAYDGFEILLDGAPCATVSLAGGDGSVRPVYLSEELAPGPHTVTLRSKTPFNLDSVAVWP